MKIGDGGLIVYSTTVTVRPPPPLVATLPTSQIAWVGLPASLSDLGATTSGAKYNRTHLTAQ